jgi:hypothetical protein
MNANERETKGNLVLVFVRVHPRIRIEEPRMNANEREAERQGKVFDWCLFASIRG